MSDYITYDFNSQTGEMVERPMTEKEISQMAENEKQIEKDIQQKAEAAAAKAALLAKLGITEEEAKLLLS